MSLLKKINSLSYWFFAFFTLLIGLVAFQVQEWNMAIAIVIGLLYLLHLMILCNRVYIEFVIFKRVFIEKVMILVIYSIFPALFMNISIVNRNNKIINGFSESEVISKIEKNGKCVVYIEENEIDSIGLKIDNCTKISDTTVILHNIQYFDKYLLR